MQHSHRLGCYAFTGSDMNIYICDEFGQLIALSIDSINASIYFYI